MTHQTADEFVKFMEEKQKKYMERFERLQENLRNGTAGLKEEFGEVYIDLGENKSISETFSSKKPATKNGNGLKHH